MRELRLHAFCGASLDGFIAGADGSVDFLKPFEGVENGYTAFFASIDTLLVGRKTYETVLGFERDGVGWVYAGKRVVVLTHRPISGTHGERAVSGEPAALVAQLEQEGARAVYVDGGQAIRTFLAAGLLDSLTVTVLPLLIGEGLPLFGGVKSTLRLVGTTTLDKGMVQLRYVLDR